MGSEGELVQYRTRLFDLIDRALKLDDHHKTYEGEIVIRYPGRFDSNIGPTMEVHCYVLGGARHYIYKATTLEGCVSLARRDLDQWEIELARREHGTEDDSLVHLSKGTEEAKEGKC